jgi:hypothetical protein
VKLRVAGFGVALVLAQCAGDDRTPHVMPSNAPDSVKAANVCVSQRPDTSLVQVGSGGRGYWVQQGLNPVIHWDVPGWPTTYSGYDVYGWIPSPEATCPNDVALGMVYDSGW